MLILHMFFGWSRQVSMGNLALSFRRWDYSSILHAAVSPIKYRGIGENRLCISIIFVLYKTLNQIKYSYLPACHVIINQHQRNHEHANVIPNY